MLHASLSKHQTPLWTQSDPAGIIYITVFIIIISIISALLILAYLFTDVSFYRQRPRRLRSSLLSAAVSHWSHLSAAQIKSLTRCRREQNTITRLSQQSPADSLSLPASPSKWNANHSARLQREFTVRLVSVWPEVSAADCQVWIYWPWNKLPGFYFLKSPIKLASCNINPVRMINWLEERTYDQTHPEKS